MERVEEFTFRIRRFMGGIGPAKEEDIQRLRRWLGRNEKRFMCILEHHFAHEEQARLIEDCERDRCMVNWLRIFKYMNILGVQLNLTVYPVILWNLPLGGAHRITYGVRFRYKKGWISKRETIRINGEDLEEFVTKQLPREGAYVAERLRSEVVKLSDYIVGVFLSPLMKCEGPREIML